MSATASWTTAGAVLAGEPIDQFIVTLRATNGEFCLYVEAFIVEECGYLKHTTVRADAKIYTFTAALDVVEALTASQVTAKVVPR